MESNYNNENFERFLRESTDQYRMYASENVWKNIYGYLHTRRRWFGIGLILLLSAGFVTTIMLTNTSVSPNHQVANNKKVSSSLKKEPVENITESESLVLAPYSNNKITTAKGKTSLLQSFTSSNEINNPTGPDRDAVNQPGITGIISENPVDGIGNAVSPIAKNDIELDQQSPAGIPERSSTNYTPIILNYTDQLTDQDVIFYPKNTTTDHHLNTVNAEPIKSNVTAGQLPTIESVINSFTRRNKKLSFQYYFTPTISYRKLNENKSYIRSQNSGASVYGNINNVVTHKPDVGLVVGVNARYTLNRSLKLRAGLQFNASRYDIKAFSYSSEQTTIALNNGYTVDSLRTTSNYRNFNGYSSDWLHNYYFQISMPVGIELKLAGDEKVQFGIAGTLQPTYMLGDHVYLLSSNYKNYAEVPSLIRHWNMNTSLEAFVSYSTGKINWQIGPQVRYQLYSSYVKEYPVKEHLFDFGLKIGISPNR